MKMNNTKQNIHVALDFDRTIHDYNKNMGLEALGAPLKPMIATVKKCLSSGGYTFTIFTARLSHDEEFNNKQKLLIQDWLEKQGLPRFDVTATKYNYFDEFWDDKAITVIKNVGVLKYDNRPNKHEGNNNKLICNCWDLSTSRLCPVHDKIEIELDRQEEEEEEIK